MSTSAPITIASRNDDKQSAGDAGASASASVSPTATGPRTLSTRPSLVRSPPEQPSDREEASFTDDDSEAQLSSGDSDSVSDDPKAGSITGTVKGEGETSSTSGDEIATLRESVNQKLLQRQQRSRGGHALSSSGLAGSQRVSPIKEEDAAHVSPSLNAASVKSPLASGARTTSTVSTGSTESARTVRGSAAVTPAASMPLRTPSYPFPYVPGTPRTWSSAFHQPFTSLSPTVSAPVGKQSMPGGESSILSRSDTPGASSTSFMPAGTAFHGPEDPRFPTPDLYELILTLSSEPGLEAWWSTVTNIMRDVYKADRVALALPADPTDIENLPWGQKATFNQNGPDELVYRKVPSMAQSAFTQGPTSAPRPELTLKEPTNEDLRPGRLHPERLRPKLESRHSFAGHGRDTREPMTTQPPARPQGPQRTVTMAAGMPARTTGPYLARKRQDSQSSIRHTSISDPDFSSIGGDINAGPYAEIFAALRPLDYEVHPLVESSGVNRVLERGGKLIAVTRDYTSDASASSSGGETRGARSDGGTAAALSTREQPPKMDTATSFGNYRSVFQVDQSAAMSRNYEEYEQGPASPWAQSPAPSPAIRADPENNPFFTSEEQTVDEAFSEADTPRDYSQYAQVEAIGIERASTVIHVPLLHPVLSQLMPPLRTKPDKAGDKPDPRRRDVLDRERKAPIAILSVLSSAVPYPLNLTDSLERLGPHLATTFAIAQHSAGSQQQVLGIRHRRTASGRNVGFAPMSIEPTTLDDIVNAELDEPAGSMSGSVTSPSDYSGRSLHSPSGSLVGTPGWDPAALGWTSSRSVAGTPGVSGAEFVDSYFDAKKKTTMYRTSSVSASQSAAQATPAKPAGKPPTYDNRSTPLKPSQTANDDIGRMPRSERRLRTPVPAKEEKSLLGQMANNEHSPLRAADPISPMKPSAMRTALTHAANSTDQRHSLLHSYGADFTASFPTVSAATIMTPSTPGTGPSHARKSSYPENPDMLPPSERLLRTIIDSLPVQIFTAMPGSGQLTWVNSKFLIYRGQDSRHVLGDPWEAIHPEDRSEYMETWNRSLRTGQQLQQKVRLKRFDRNYRWFYVRAAPLKDKRQQIVHWIGTNMDFHEQHIAELNAARQQETAASEAKYRALANSSPQIVFTVNKSKGVSFCNSQWLTYSGQTESQALGVGFMDHVHPDDLVKCRLPTFDDGNSKHPTNVPTTMPPEPRRSMSTSTSKSSDGSSETERGISSSDSSSPISQMPQAQLSQLASTGILKVSRDSDGRPSYSTEVRLKSKDGDFRWHLVRVLLAEPPLQLAADEETWYGTCTDINDHKTLERDLKETMDEKSRFLSNMSHEIRTPLNGITGMVNFLIDSSLTAEQMEHVNIIRASTEGLRGLINDILDLSKAEAGMIQLNMDWLHVRSLIEEVNDLTSAMAIDKGLELNYLVEEDVPSMIKGDRFRIRQILLNVIVNAIKFTSVGEVFVRCSTHVDEEHPLPRNELFIMFEVIDTGRGFNDKEAQYLFKRFSQIDGSSTRQNGGTGLGLVISRQLAQLHGGDMSAKGVPGKGSNFIFLIKSILPSKDDRPPLPPPTPRVPDLPLTSVSSATATPTPTPMPRVTKMPSLSERQQSLPQSPHLLKEFTASPSPQSPDTGRDSPSLSSASSDPSIRSVGRTSMRSSRSSASSFVPDPPMMLSPPMKLVLPPEQRPSRADTKESISIGSGDSDRSNETIRPYPMPVDAKLASPGGSLLPPMYSILVVCPLKYSREATVQHIDMTLPKNIPHQITARESLVECQKMLGGDDTVIFTHVVVVLQDVSEITALMDQILLSRSHASTCVIIITDLSQKRKIVEQAPQFNYPQLEVERKVRFIFKPLKPSRFAVIFDPQKEREMSTDRNQDSAQQVAVNQKQVFEELTKRLGNRDKRVLLVEDNKVNQMVILKFLSKVSIPVETALDGVQCTDKVFVQSHGFYSIILCDLHMPNKDGYQTCKEIRKWEKKNKYPHLPIIALSANVLGDVHAKCVEAGFNSYLTKPVDFKELSQVMMAFMDPSDPGKPHEFMKIKRMPSQGQNSR